MALVVGLVAEFLLAVGIRARERLLFQVDATVCAQIVRLRESFTTFQANVRLFIGMSTSMSRQMDLLSKAFSTVSTTKRLLTGVNA